MAALARKQYIVIIVLALDINSFAYSESSEVWAMFLAQDFSPPKHLSYARLISQNGTTVGYVTKLSLWVSYKHFLSTQIAVGISGGPE